MDNEHIKKYSYDVVAVYMTNAEFTSEQFQYLMLRLNLLDPKVKEVHPKKVL